MSARPWLSAAACAFLGVLSAFAQTNPGRISGTVTDSSGARIAGAAVTVTNQATGLTSKAKTDNSGYYLVANLPVGTYNVEVEHAGFRKAEKTGYDLVDDGRITADFALQVGAVTEKVQVSAVAGDTVNTVSGELSRTISAEQVADLALNGRNYMQLVSLVPGVALTSLDQMALTTSLSVGNQSINGNRTDSNHLMVDGGMNLDSGSNTSQINNVGVDFIQEVSVQTSAFSAQYGRNSGGSVNVVTKSGGDRFHGSLFETIRNDYLDAKDYFAPVKPELRFNDFGWSLGGPIAVGPLKRSKLFFFAGQEWKKIQRFTNPTRQTLPTLAEIGGDFSDRTNAINSPGTTTPIPNKNLTNLMTPDGRAVMAVYGAMIKYASLYTGKPATNNATFQVLNPFRFREDLVRMDWRPAERHNVYFRWIHDNYDTIDPFGSFTASSLPTTPTFRNRPGYGPQFGYTWVIAPTLINEAKINSSWNGQRTPLQGTNWERNTYGFQFPRTYGGNGEYPTGIPDVTVSSFASFNGPARVFLSSPTTDIAISDNVTYIHDTHALKAGVSVIRNRKDQNGRTVYDGSIAFNPSGNTNSTGYSLADAALGQFQTYTEAGSDPQGFFRFTQIESYVEDSWHATKSLSLTVGMRYSYFTPIYTVANNIVNFVPALYNPAQAVTITRTGLIVPGSGNPYNGLIRAGDGVPSDQVGRVPGATSPATLAIPAGAPRGLYNPANLFMPRFSFAWVPFGMKKMVVRGGFGSFHDRTQGNLIFSQSNLPPYSYQSQYQNGNLASPSGGAIAAPAPQGTIHALDPNLKVPVTYTYNFGIQRELPYGMLLSVDYAGHVSHHLFRSPNINEPSLDALLANQALPSAGRPVTNAIVPYKGYSTINEFLSDANDNYNALQAYLTKRKGNLVMTVAYTWSKALTDASAYNSAGDAIEGADRHFNYGPASYDRRHIFVGTYTYRIPLLRDRRGFLGSAFGGWQLSGITRFQSGALITPTGSSVLPGTRRSSYLGGPVALPSDQRGPDHWFNTGAFANAPATALGNAGVGIIEGPGWENWDVSLRKNFRVREGWNLGFTADAFNVLNHVNFDDPNVTTSSTSIGTISTSQPARNIQFGLRFSF
jgi:hypothetical protein